MGYSTELKRKDPIAYAKGAIAELSRQLETAQTDSKKQKLKSRIAAWEKKLTEAA